MAKEWLLSSGILMGWSLGANDSANVFGTGVASGLVGYRTAIFVAAVFVLLGSIIEGEKCMGSLGALTALSHSEAFFAMLSSGLTMTIFTLLALPASTSQAIVGALMGIAVYHGNPDFSALGKFLTCWVLTPIGGIICSVALYKPLKTLVMKGIRSPIARNRVFLVGILITGSYGAYSLGSNNVANVTGVYVTSGLISPFWGLLIGGVSIAAGVLTYSRKTMMTVGKSIVPLDPFSGLLAVFSESLVLHVFTQVGIPVSSSQAIVGGVLGVGIARDIRTVNFRVMGKIFCGWIITPVISGSLAWIAVFMENAFKGGRIMEWLNFLWYRFPTSGVETYLFVPPLVMFIASSITATGGISGAFLLLPFQVSVLKYTSPGASATNFIYNIVAIPGGVYRYIRDGKFSWTLFLSLMIGTLPGVFFGYWMRIVYLPDPKRFKFFVGCVLLYLGLRTIWSAIGEFRTAGGRPKQVKGRITKENFGLRSAVVFENQTYVFSSLGVMIVALFVGVIGGAYGIGGGALMAPYLISVLELPVYIVSGAALCSTWVTSILGAIIYAIGPLSGPSTQTSPDWLLGALFGLGGFLGTYFGAWLQKYLPSSWIKTALGIVIVYIAIRYVWPMISGLIS